MFDQSGNNQKIDFFLQKNSFWCFLQQFGWHKGSFFRLHKEKIDKVNINFFIDNFRSDWFFWAWSILIDLYKKIFKNWQHYQHWYQGGNNQLHPLILNLWLYVYFYSDWEFPLNLHYQTRQKLYPGQVTSYKSSRDYTFIIDFYFWLFFVLNSIFHFSVFTYSIKTLRKN